MAQLNINQLFYIKVIINISTWVLKEIEQKQNNDVRKVKQVLICLLSESVQSAGVVLENVADDMSRDLLLMLVENISGLDDSCFSLEIIWESNRAAVTFSNAAGQKTQKHWSTWRPAGPDLHTKTRSQIDWLKTSRAIFKNNECQNIQLVFNFRI